MITVWCHCTMLQSSDFCKCCLFHRQVEFSYSKRDLVRSNLVFFFFFFYNNSLMTQWIKVSQLQNYWRRQHFFLLCWYNIKQSINENKEKISVKDYQLIQYQILQTNTMRLVWQKVRRITVTKCQKKHPCVDQWKKFNITHVHASYKKLIPKIGWCGGGKVLTERQKGKWGWRF